MPDRVPAGAPPRHPRSAAGAPRPLAVDAVLCRVVRVEEFRAILAGHTAIALELMRMVASRLRTSDRRLVEFGAYDITRRVALLLADMAASQGRPSPGGTGVTVPGGLSQDDLAGLVGGSRESVARALERQAQREQQNLKRGINLLATVGSTAPFVGLLGTVVGIINAFQQMAATGSGGLATVSGGIAEALVTTAFGLLVAIPAVMAYNYMQGWVDARMVDMTESANELLDHVARKLDEGSTAAPARAV